MKIEVHEQCTLAFYPDPGGAILMQGKKKTNTHFNVMDIGNGRPALDAWGSERFGRRPAGHGPTAPPARAECPGLDSRGSCPI
ncbi:MAG: hypothetical protein K0Q68_20 [Moraxellaceae bacterium]|jgi:hypothetical protein|nr:hypothetical protein [Moraxellaceae bacterium]